MEPFDMELPSDRSARPRVLVPDLESDVACAAASGLPVLISAEADVAEWLARVIHDRSERHAEPFVRFRPGRGDQFRLVQSLLNGAGPGRGTVFVSDVSRATREVQGLLRDALAAPQPDPNLPFRIIAGTSVWLFDQVERGEFDHYLFYRLNKIHIRVVGSESARERGGTSSGGSEESAGTTPIDLQAFQSHVMLRAGLAARLPHARAAARR